MAALSSTCIPGLTSRWLLSAERIHPQFAAILCGDGKIDGLHVYPTPANFALVERAGLNKPKTPCMPPARSGSGIYTRACDDKQAA